MPETYPCDSDSALWFTHNIRTSANQTDVSFDLRTSRVDGKTKGPVPPPSRNPGLEHQHKFTDCPTNSGASILRKNCSKSASNLLRRSRPRIFDTRHVGSLREVCRTVSEGFADCVHAHARMIR
jgi:hypothetical protein